MTGILNLLLKRPEMNVKPVQSTRRHDLDWLRVLSILVVFIFHSGRFFDQGGWHVKSATTYLGVQIWTTFLAHWMMPLIFVISGASLFYALAKRGAGFFIKDRALRLLVPLVVGMFTHIAWQVYLERLTHGEFQGSFLDFLPHYFSGFYAFGGNFAWMGLHLWYLEMLFLFSVALLPLFWWLRRGSGQQALAWVGNWLVRPGAIYLLALPIMLLVDVLDPATPWGQRNFGGWSLIVYVLFLLYGFAIFAHAGVQASITRLRGVSLLIGVVCCGALVVLWAGQGDPTFGTARYLLIFSIFGLSAWCWILAALGYGMHYLSRPAPWLEHANEGVLPFYVLHQTVILTVGYYVLQWPLPDLVQWTIIAASSFVICIGLYEVTIRRVNVLRVLFGMKPVTHTAAVRHPKVIPA
jgi:peptidoglycan/LPS O-acetylase OafA/YrhL